MAVQLADEAHWNDLVIIIAVVCDLCCTRHPTTYIAHRHVASMIAIVDSIVTHFHVYMYFPLYCALSDIIIDAFICVIRLVPSRKKQVAPVECEIVLKQVPS